MMRRYTVSVWFTFGNEDLCTTVTYNNVKRLSMQNVLLIMLEGMPPRLHLKEPRIIEHHVDRENKTEHYRMKVRFEGVYVNDIEAKDMESALTKAADDIYRLTKSHCSGTEKDYEVLDYFNFTARIIDKDTRTQCDDLQVTELMCYQMMRRIVLNLCRVNRNNLHASDTPNSGQKRRYVSVSTRALSGQVKRYAAFRTLSDMHQKMIMQLFYEHVV